MTDSLFPLSPPAAAGVSTATPAAPAAAAPPSATPATAGGRRAGAKAGGGATTSRPSTRASTPRGKRPAPPSAPSAEPPTILPPSPCWEFMRAGQQALAQEIYFVRGALDLTTAQHQLQLDPGCWVLMRWAPGPEPMDGWATVMPSLAEVRAGEGES